MSMLKQTDLKYINGKGKSLGRKRIVIWRVVSRLTESTIEEVLNPNLTQQNTLKKGVGNQNNDETPSYSPTRLASFFRLVDIN